MMWLKDNWPYLAGPAWFTSVWLLDDFRGAFLSCLGMFLISLLFLWEAGGKIRSTTQSPPPIQSVDQNKGEGL